ncbi:MAG: acyl-CoA dehydrogenase family protein, partial [Trebonia sp.]
MTDSRWELDQDHLDFRATVRHFVDRQVRPVVEEAEQLGRPPDHLMKELGAAGLLGLAIPEADGGGGGDALAIALLAEELARASGGIAVTALVSGYMAAPHIARFGSAAQRARYLPGIASGESIAAIAVTEPGVGSNVAGIQTKAERDGDGYRITGTKMFITNAGIADVLVVAARTGPDPHNGITTFLVDAGTPGLSFGAPLRKMGWHGSDTREVVMDDVHVPAGAVLGHEGRGFHQIMAAFQLERVTLAAMGLGHAAECLDAATRYAAEREVFEAALINLQSMRHRLAAMSVDLEAARLLTYQ